MKKGFQKSYTYILHILKTVATVFFGRVIGEKEA